MSHRRTLLTEHIRPRITLAAASAALLLLLLLAGCSLSDAGLATRPLESNSLEPLSGMEPRSFFGDAVAIDGGVVAVGAWGAQSERGAVRLYRLDNGAWQPTDLLQPAEVQEGDRFGHALALDGDELVVGAPRTVGVDLSEDAGAVYYFRSSAGEWALEQKLTPPAGAGPAHFGNAVALEAGTLAVVASAAGEQTLHIYDQGSGSWTLSQSFPLDTLGVGHRLAMGEELIAVGARRAGGSGAEGNQGLLRLFARTAGGWAEAPAPAPSEPGDCFGCQVAISGNLLAVGSPSTREGAVFVYRWEGGAWQPSGRVAAGNDSAHFGQAVALTGDHLFVGAPGDDGAGENVGRLFIYTLGGAEPLPAGEFSPDHLPVMSNFGGAVAAYGQTLVAGASGVAGATGAAFVLELAAD